MQPPPTPAGPAVRFLRLIPSVRAPQRADRTAAGMLPIRAARYCDAITSACAWGWWVFPPLDLSFHWDGETVFWSCAEFPDWMALDDAAQFPHFAARFDTMAPPEAQGCAPPFLTRLPEPGTIQLWTGPLFANLRLTRTHHPIRLSTDLPLLQIQPLPRHAYADAILDSHITTDTPTPDDRAGYIRDIVIPNDDPNRTPGRYAIATRRRRKCPAAR